MLVFKFGGASINSVERIRNLAQILNSYQNEKILIVISAIGKTTNALEKVAEAYFAAQPETAFELFEQIKKDHLQIADLLVIKETDRLKNIFTEVEWLLHDRPV